MTNREYILSKLAAFEISDAQLEDMSVDLEAVYKPESNEVGIPMVMLIEELVLAPRRTKITENGFSVSWDYQNLGKYYLWLCRKYGIKPNENVEDLLGLSRIVDRTNSW